MKTTVPGSPFIPHPPRVSPFESRVMSEESLQASVVESAPLIPTDPVFSGTSSFDEILAQLESPSDMINFDGLFDEFYQVTKYLIEKRQMPYNEMKAMPVFISRVFPLIEAIPQECLIQLFFGLQCFIDSLQTKTTSPTLKSPKPITIIPVVKGMEKKLVPKLSQPKVIQAKLYLHSTSAEILPPLQDENLIPMINLLTSKALFFYHRASNYQNSVQTSKFLIQTLFSNPDFLTKTYCAAALCQLACDEPTRKLCFQSTELAEGIMRCLSVENDRNASFAHFITQIVTLVRLLSNESNFDTSRVAIEFVKIIRVFPTHQMIVLNVFQFLEEHCNDPSVRNSPITEFGAELIITLFLQLLSIFKNNDPIITRICYTLFVFIQKEFDISDSASYLTDPVSIAVCLEILPDLPTTESACSVLSLIGAFAANKACITIMAKSMHYLFSTNAILSNQSVAPLIINVIRLFALSGENIQSHELDLRFDDWFSIEGTEVAECALSLAYDLTSHSKLSLSVIKIILSYVGDENLGFSFLAIHALAASATNPDIISIGPKIDSRVRRTLSAEELDEGTIRELICLFNNLPKGVLSSETLDDARAFDDLAIATI